MNFEQFMEVIKKQVSDMIWLDKVDASISEFKKNDTKISRRTDCL